MANKKKNNNPYEQSEKKVGNPYEAAEKKASKNKNESPYSQSYTQSGNKKSSGKRRYSIISQKSPFAAREAYKSARTNLMFLMKKQEEENNNKALLFTSPYSGEGKTITCINLAITFAQTGSKVVVIDADMRKPQIHNALGLKNDVGLSEILAGFSDLSAIKKTTIDSLSIITSGTVPPNPSELIMSANFDKLIRDLTEMFDIICIDTPPVGIVTDAAVISAKGIPAILEIRQNYTSMPAVTEVKQLISQAGGSVMGYIFNDVVNLSSAYGYNYRYNRLRYSGYSRYGNSGYGSGGYGGYSSYDSNSYGYGSGYGYGYGSGYGYGYGSKGSSKFNKINKPEVNKTAPATDNGNKGADEKEGK